MESSATYAGHEAVSDGELNQSLDLTNEGVSPAPPPTLEDAMQRLAETIKEFDSHAMTDQAKSNDTIQARQQPKQNMSQGQIIRFAYICLHFM